MRSVPPGFCAAAGEDATVASAALKKATARAKRPIGFLPWRVLFVWPARVERTGERGIPASATVAPVSGLVEAVIAEKAMAGYGGRPLPGGSRAYGKS